MQTVADRLTPAWQWTSTLPSLSRALSENKTSWNGRYKCSYDTKAIVLLYKLTSWLQMIKNKHNIFVNNVDRIMFFLNIFALHILFRT